MNASFPEVHFLVSSDISDAKINQRCKSAEEEVSLQQCLRARSTVTHVSKNQEGNSRLDRELQTSPAGVNDFYRIQMFNMKCKWKSKTKLSVKVFSVSLHINTTILSVRSIRLVNANEHITPFGNGPNLSEDVIGPVRNINRQIYLQACISPQIPLNAGKRTK